MANLAEAGCERGYTEEEIETGQNMKEHACFQPTSTSLHVRLVFLMPSCLLFLMGSAKPAII